MIVSLTITARINPLTVPVYQSLLRGLTPDEVRVRVIDLLQPKCPPGVTIENATIKIEP